MRSRRLLLGRKAPNVEGDIPDYEQIWYCVRLSSDDTFPDGREVPVKAGWNKSLPPIWVKLGEGISWAGAITFGAAKHVLEDAAKSFGAKRIVWLNKKNKTDFPENSQDTRSDKKRGVA